MANKRTIINTGQPLIDVSGNILPGIKLRFSLVDVNGGKDARFTTDTNEFVADEVETTTDANGEFSVSLVANDLIDGNTSYRVTIPSNVSGYKAFQSPLPYSVNSITFADFFALQGTILNSTQLGTLDAHVVDKSLHMTADQNAAFDAANAPSASNALATLADTGPGSGQTNTASNVGTAGVGVFKQKTGVDLEFKNVNAGSSKVTVTDDTGNDEIDIDVVEANFTLGNLGGTLGIAKGGTGQTTAQAAIDALSQVGAATNEHVLTKDTGTGNAQWKASVGGGGGEANTASNVGTAGVGVFKQKTGVDIELKKINAGSNKVTITDDVANSEIDIDVVEASINHDALINYVLGQHRTINDAGTGATDLFSAQKVIVHTSDVTNPHAVTAPQVPIAVGTGTPTVDQLQEYIDHIGSSGYFHGGVLSDGGAGTLDITAGQGMIRDTASSIAPLKSFAWSAVTGMAIPNDTSQYVYVNPAGVVSINTSEFLEAENLILLGIVTDEAGVIVDALNMGVNLNESIARIGLSIRRTHGIERDKRKGGLIAGETGTRNVTLSAGSLWWAGFEYLIAAFDSSGADTFDIYSSGGKEATAVSQWPNTQYDNATVLTTLDNNKWTTLWMFLEADRHIIFSYGTAQYNSQGEAEMEGLPVSLPNRLSSHSTLVARFVFQKSAPTASISSAFDSVFANTGITDHLNLANIGTNSHAAIDTHIADVTNPHTVTATQAGATPIAHATDTTNPHTVTKAQVGLANAEDLKVNLAATIAPVVTDDSASGYSVLSRWADITADKAYVCLDATVGAAVWIETTAGAGGSGESVTKTFTKVAHGLAVGDAVYNDGTADNAWVKAKADSILTTAIAIVSAVAGNDFDITLSGYVSGLSGLTAGDYHFVSDATAGALTTTEPDISNPVLYAMTATTAMVLPYRPSSGLAGATNANKNAIINGNPTINQRGYVSATATTGANEYTLDRWRVVTSGQALTFGTALNVVTMTLPVGGIEQVIEGLNIQSKTYVISFVSTGDTVCTVDGVTKVSGDTFTLVGGTNATIKFSSAAGTGTVKLIQVEIGSSATAFEYRNYGTELAMCQRYYQEIPSSLRFTAALANETVDTSITFLTSMRVIPTVLEISGGTQFNLHAASPVLYATNVAGARFEMLSLAAGDAYSLNTIYSYDAEL